MDVIGESVQEKREHSGLAKKTSISSMKSLKSLASSQVPVGMCPGSVIKVASDKRTSMTPALFQTTMWENELKVPEAEVIRRNVNQQFIGARESQGSSGGEEAAASN